FIISKRQQEKLAGDIRVASVRCLFIGSGQQGLQIAAYLDITLGALNLRQRLYLCLQRRTETVNPYSGPRQQAARPAVAVGKQSRQHVGRFYVWIVVFDREALCVSNSLLEFCG